MAKKPTRADLEARIASLQPYELLASLRHIQYIGSPIKACDRAPIVKNAIVDAHGGRYDVTVTLYGHWRVDSGVIEVVSWPLRDDGTRGDGPLVEVHGGLWAAEATKAYRAWHHDAEYTAPWASMIRWVLTDGIRLANAADDKRKAEAENAPPWPPSYRIHEITPDGPWISESFKGDERHAAQNVIAGFTRRQPRWAVEEGTYRFLYGLDAKGERMKEAPPAPIDDTTPEREDEGTSPASERVS